METWELTLAALAETPSAVLYALANHRLLRFESTLRTGKGGVRVARDAEDTVVALIIRVALSQSRAEQEVTLLHELFHLVLGAEHPQGHVMMRALSETEYRRVEDQIDAAAYEFRRRHPEFTAALYDECFSHHHAPILAK